MTKINKDHNFSLSNFHTIIFDFDGVFTDNKVWTNELGEEMIRCDRGDGLAIDILRKFIELNNIQLNYFILSKEKNNVVISRAKKMKMNCFYGINNKYDFVSNYLKSESKKSLGLMYVGNDLNDLKAMNLAEFVAAPINSHPLVIERANLVLPQKGGEGFVRSLIEKLLNFERMTAKQIVEFV